MITLGINAAYHDSAVPCHAIDYCLVNTCTPRDALAIGGFLLEKR